MKRSFSRRIAAIGSIAAVFAVIVTAAFAAELSPNAASLPSKNPTDLKAAQGTAWTQQLSGDSYLGRTTSFTEQWGSSVDALNGNLTISKETTKNDTGYVTITITSTRAGLIIMNGMVTASGGQSNAVQIASTTLASNGKSFTIKLRMPGEEGTPPLLTIKWYSMQAWL
jgi:hypothetical protein